MGQLLRAEGRRGAWTEERGAVGDERRGKAPCSSARRRAGQAESPYAFYRFWINTGDAEVPRLLRVFTFRSRAEILALDEAVRDRPAEREGQRVLAEDVTTLVHGARECGRVAAASRALFGHGELAELDEETLAAALAEVRPFRIEAGPSGSPPAGGRSAQALPTGRLPVAGLPVADLMVAAGIVPTLSAARRAIAEGGAYLNNRRVPAAEAVVRENDLLHGRYLVLRRGKRIVGGVEVVDRRPRPTRSGAGLLGLCGRCGWFGYARNP